MPPPSITEPYLQRVTRWVWVAGSALMLAITLSMAGLASLERVNAFDEQHGRAALLARVLEDHGTRGIEATQLALSALAGQIATAGDEHVGGRGAGPLTQALTGLPNVRAIALLDHDGQVLSSSAAGEAGLMLNLAALGAPAGQRGQIGPAIAGRGLAALNRLQAPPPAPRGMAFIPLLHRFRSGDGQPLLLVALLNPDQFANYQLSTLNDDDISGRALLASFDGQLLASSDGLAPGASLASHAIWQQRLFQREHGTLVGTGSDGTRLLIAYRASRTQPLIAIVETPLSRVDARWWQAMRWPLAFASGGLLLVLGSTLLAARALRSRRAARQQIDAAQARVARSEQDLSVLVRSVQNVLFRTDVAGTISFVNLRWAALSGTAPEQAIGQRLHDMVAPEDVARVAALFEPQRDDEVRRAPSVAIRLGAQPHWFDIAVVPLRDADGLVGFAGSAADVSERWRAEQHLQAARDVAEEASRAKSEFIANISHELRTPLQSIIGFSELGQLRGRSQPKLAGMFTDIHAAGQRMLMLVNDLLDVAKIENTVGTFHLQRTDLHQLAHEVLQELRPLLAERSLTLRLVTGMAPLVARVDPLRIHQALRNVLANAIKFAPAGSIVEVQGLREADGRLAFRVRDHGPGIPPAELDAIFEAFVQSSRTKDGAGGTGLGLAICRKILRAHGGDVQAANAEGGGAVFTLWLPDRCTTEALVTP